MRKFLLVLLMTSFGSLTQMGHVAAQNSESALPGLRASALRGVEVIALDQNSIGEIDDLVISRDGQVRAVVIQSGGVGGIGAKKRTVPFTSLMWNTERDPQQHGGGGVLFPRNAPPQPAVNESRGPATAVAGTGELRRAVLKMTEAAEDLSEIFMASKVPALYVDRSVLVMNRVYWVIIDCGELEWRHVAA